MSAFDGVYACSSYAYLSVVTTYSDDPPHSAFARASPYIYEFVCVSVCQYVLIRKRIWVF